MQANATLFILGLDPFSSPSAREVDLIFPLRNAQVLLSQLILSTWNEMGVSWLSPDRCGWPQAGPLTSQCVYLEGVAVRRACCWLEAGYGEESILKKREAAVAQGVWRGRAPLGEDAGCSPGTTAPASVCASRSALLGLVQRRAWSEQSQRRSWCQPRPALAPVLSFLVSILVYFSLFAALLLPHSLSSRAQFAISPFIQFLSLPWGPGPPECDVWGHRRAVALAGLRWGSAFEKGSAVEACAGPGHVGSTVVRGSVRREEKFCMECLRS